jgi:hypothetical protein
VTAAVELLVDEPLVITEPGVYDIPTEAYHADPVPGGSLSSTGARKLLPPSCPALYRHWRDNGGDEHKPAWDLGTAAHKLVLGVGPDLVLVDRDRWDTKEVKERVAAIREAGGVPLKREPYETVHAMAKAIREHRVAAALLTQRGGQPEATVVWRDERTGVWCRALIDYLPAPTAPARLLFADYKTGRSAAPDKLGRIIADFGYHVQLAWYLMGIQAIGHAEDDAQALLVVQETTAPYLVTVSLPDTTAMRLGAIRCRQALDLYAECVRDDRWPGYGDEVVVTELPPWETRELEGQIW